jgi:hypothetical protein
MNLPKENIGYEPKVGFTNKNITKDHILVTLMSSSGIEKCWVKPNEPFIIKDGRKLVVNISGELKSLPIDKES